MKLPAYWIGVGAAAGLGGIVGFLAGRGSIEKEVRAEYAESVEMLKRTFEQANSEAPVPDIVREIQKDMREALIKEENAALSALTLDHEPKPFIETIVERVKEEYPEVEVMTLHEPDYAKAVAAQETDVEIFVSGGINDYGVSYVEDSDYEEENGFDKYRVDIMMDEHNPTFWMDGQPIDDWDKRLGDSILVDMYQLCPPGTAPVLYVRNHAVGEDYEVVLVTQP